MTTIRIHIQDLNARHGLEGYQYFTSNWSLPRNHRYTYRSDLKGIDACEEAFHIFNAPEDLLEEWQKYIARAYKGPSFSVGDVVEVDGVEYICCSFGWKKREEELAVH